MLVVAFRLTARLASMPATRPDAMAVPVPPSANAAELAPLLPAATDNAPRA